MADQVLSVGADFSEVFAGIDQIGEAFDRTVQSFQQALGNLDFAGVTQGLQDAIAAATSQPLELTVDTGTLDSAISDAVGAADPTVTVGGDATDVTTSINDAIQASDTTTPPITADTASVTSDVTGAVDAADTTTAPIRADTTNLTAEVTDAIDSVQPHIVIPESSVDASGVTDAINSAAVNVDIGAAMEAGSGAAQGLAQDESSLGDAAAGASGKIEGLAASTKGLNTVVAGASGGLVGAAESADFLGGHAAIAAGALVGMTAGLATIGQAGIEATAAEDRFNQTFGKFGDVVNNVHIEGLTGNLQELGLKLGSTGAAMQNAEADAGNFFRAAGLGGKEVAGLAQETVLLAARAEALHPALGTVSDIADKLPAQMARASSGFRLLNIPVSQAAVATSLFNRFGIETISQATPQQRSIAGIDAAYRTLSHTLGGDINEAMGNVIIKEKSLTAQTANTLEELGKPVANTFLQFLHDAAPASTAFGEVLKTLAQGVLPILSQSLNLLVPALNTLGGAFGHIPPGVLEAVAAFLALQTVSRALGEGVLAVGGIISDQFIRIREGGGSLSKVVSNLFSSARYQDMQLFSAGVTGLAEAMGRLAIGGAIAVQSFQAIRSGSQSATVGMLGLTAAGALIGSTIAPGIGTAVGAATGAVAGLAASFLRTDSTAKDFTKSLADTAVAIDKSNTGFDTISTFAEAAQGKVIDLWNAFATGQTISASLASGGLTQLISRLKELATVDPAAAAKALQSFAESGLLASVNAKTGADAQGKLTTALNDGKKAYSEHAANAEQDASANRQAAASAVDVDQQYQILAATLFGAATAHSRLSQAFSDNADQFKVLSLAAANGVQITDVNLQAMANQLGLSIDDLKRFQSEFKSGFDALVTGAQNALPKLTDVFQGMDKAFDPKKFTQNLLDHLNAVRAFSDGLTVITRGGFENVAALFAQMGPDLGNQAITWFEKLPAGMQTAMEGLIQKARDGDAQAKSTLAGLGVDWETVIGGWKGNVKTGAQTAFAPIAQQAQSAADAARKALAAIPGAPGSSLEGPLAPSEVGKVKFLQDIAAGGAAPSAGVQQAQASGTTAGTSFDQAAADAVGANAHLITDAIGAINWGGPVGIPGGTVAGITVGRQFDDAVGTGIGAFGHLVTDAIGVALLTAAATGIAGSTSAGLAVARQFDTAIAYGIGAFADEFVAAVDASFLTAAAAGVVTATSGGLAVARQFDTAVGYGIGAFGDAIVGAVARLPFAAASGPATLHGLAIGLSFDSGVALGIASLGGTVAAAANGLPFAAVSGVATLHGFQVGNSYDAGIGAGIVSSGGLVAATGNGLPWLEPIGTAISQGTAVGFAYDGGVAAGIRSGQGVVAAAAGSLNFGDATAAAFSGGFGIGRSIDAGIAAGVRSGGGMITGAADTAALAALNQAKSTLGINTPSRVFAEQVGEPIAEGIALGITNGKGMIADALDLSSLATAAVRSAPGLGLNVQPNFNDASQNSYSIQVTTGSNASPEAIGAAVQASIVDLVAQRQVARSFTTPL